MPKKAKEKVFLNKEEIALKGLGYFNTKAKIKTLEDECKGLRTPLEDAVKAMGVKTDKGSEILALPHADKEVQLKRTLRVNKVLLPEAIDVLRENGLSECVEDVPTVREDVIDRLYAAGEISDELLQKIYGVKTSYAFSVDVKKRYEV